MKTFGKILLWFFAIIGILVVISVFVLAKSIPVKKKVVIKPNSFLELKLGGVHHDYNQYEGIFFMQEKASIGELCRKLDTAKQDSRIKGVILKPELYMGGWALTKELRDKLLDFKKTGKKIYSYINIAVDKGYYLASVSDSVFLNPSMSGGIALRGIGAEINFYKGLLDKIGIEFTVLHQGKYKGAGEIFSRKTMSEPMRKNYTKFVDDMYSQYISDIAENRNLPKSTIENIMEKRPDFLISGQRAVDLGLVDVLCSEGKFKSIIKNHPLVDIKDYSNKIKIHSPNKIAVLYAQGNIVMSGNKEGFTNDYRKITEKNIADELDRIQKTNSIKALVLRVNSGGGSALVSDIILNDLEKIKAKMPVVVSMGDLAASGGYYISCGADYIFAQPNTLTGSIGVVGMMINWQKLRKWADVNTYQIKKGKYAGFFSPNFSPSQEDKESMDLMMENVYNEFKKKVANGRDMSLSEVEKIAQGYVWTGMDAVKIGLVDKLGGLDDAIAKAAKMAGIRDYSVSVYPPKKGLIDIIKEENLFDVETIVNFYLMNTNKKLFKEIINQKNLVDMAIQEPINLIMPFNINLN